MQHTFSIKGVPVSGAPFLLGKCLQAGLLFCCATQTSYAENCAAIQTSERVQVIHVYDGDTVKLKDGRRLRFIGINTPETDHENKAGQAYASEAKALLQQLLDNHNRTLLLQAGKENKDHYDRMLAHVFLEDGTNVAARLLQKGLATTLVVPPNTWGQNCYQQHEDHARIEGLGLWGLESHKAKESKSLPGNTRGFRIIRGKVQNLHRSPHSVWINMEGTLAIRIDKKDLVNFAPGFIKNLEGQRIETRGWVKPVRGRLQMSVRHPAALARITQQKDNPSKPGHPSK